MIIPTAKITANDNKKTTSNSKIDCSAKSPINAPDCEIQGTAKHTIEVMIRRSFLVVAFRVPIIAGTAQP